MRHIAIFNWVIDVHTGGPMITSVRGTDRILPLGFEKKKLGTFFGYLKIFFKVMSF